MFGISSQKTLELLKDGDQALLKKIYEDNRDVFINFSKRYNISKEDAIDIYQDTIIVFYENIVEGKNKYT